MRTNAIRVGRKRCVNVIIFCALFIIILVIVCKLQTPVVVLVVNDINVINGTRKVVSYSLFGNTERYTKTAVLSAQSVFKHLEGWTPRFYVSPDVSQKLRNTLIGLNSEVIRVSSSEHSHYDPMYSRMWVSSDPSLERYIVRDVDSPITLRDKAVVEDWERRGTLFHTIHDHPQHNAPIMGGLWGGMFTTNLDIESVFLKALSGRDNGPNDQYFLLYYIWPVLKKNLTCYASFKFDTIGPCVPIPVKRRGYEFLGNPVNEMGEESDNESIRKSIASGKEIISQKN